MMHVGLLTDSLSGMPLTEALDAAAALGIESVEIATGNWSNSPHINLDAMLSDSTKQKTLLNEVAMRGMRIAAFNASGNILHPVSGGEQSDVARKTIRLAADLGVDTVVMMSGLPAARGDSAPNWVTTCWPPDVLETLEYQWNEVAIPYWLELAGFARSNGVRRIALELHPHQLVYNVKSFERLRAAVGDTVGVNLDPSHLMWMGADPITVIRALGPAIYHVHAKDTRIEPEASINTGYEVRPFKDIQHRAWNYVTLGHGNEEGQEFWNHFIEELRLVGYDGVLSIEHEDAAMSQIEGVRESVDVLRKALAFRPAAV